MLKNLDRWTVGSSYCLPVDISKAKKMLGAYEYAFDLVDEMGVMEGKY